MCMALYLAFLCSTYALRNLWESIKFSFSSEKIPSDTDTEIIYNESELIIKVHLINWEKDRGNMYGSNICGETLGTWLPAYVKI